ncbi:DUF1273 domain-containing protein [Bacillus sp. HMF5848]|uniref:DUF1273 domain-containing protein n=1 Tax=Bacillus sp. HMF5848 TaxID=2495421 RepID=UPI000F7B23AF|nr:DUF1273 domain-containing protein [Bacillus sp. HMF5848]RSK29337.1 DUF1273 domain-containing protein [Bacillus sp. HMF5848]
MKVFVITGYKSFELGIFNQKHEAIKYIKKAIKNELLTRIDEGLEWVVISGQLGVELWTAEVAIELRENYPHLKLAVLTPFMDQESKWNENLQEYYHSILHEADFVETITNRPYEGPWQFKAKDELLLSKSDGSIIVYDEEKEGSPKYFLEKAREYGNTSDYQVIQITLADLQNVIEEEQWENDENV